MGPRAEYFLLIWKDHLVLYELTLGSAVRSDCLSWRRKWQPTPVFLPGKSHKEARQAPVHGVSKSQTRLSMHTQHLGQQLKFWFVHFKRESAHFLRNNILLYFIKIYIVNTYLLNFCYVLGSVSSVLNAGIWPWPRQMCSYLRGSQDLNMEELESNRFLYMGTFLSLQVLFSPHSLWQILHLHCLL